jgi:hypothetical protein
MAFWLAIHVSNPLDRIIEVARKPKQKAAVVSGAVIARDSYSVKKQHRACDHQQAADKHDDDPAASGLIIAALRAAL